jgi:tetratricopeptide (TPR) repeat protein
MNSESTLNDALMEVDVAIAAQNHERAIALVNELLTTHLDAIGVWRARARAFEATGRPLPAAEAWGRVLDALPADRDAMAALARNLQAAGNLNEARIWARQALDYWPGNTELLRIASMPGEVFTPDALSMAFRAALAQTQVGLLARGVTALRRVTAQHPERIDMKVALAHALWTYGSHVNAAQVCQSILDEQPDCLNAHILLMQLWQHAGATALEQTHRNAIDRIDPDHRVTVELLGTQAPVSIQDVPAVRAMTAAQPSESPEDDVSREDWVDRLVAAASSTPTPLRRDVDAPPANRPAATAGSTATTEDPEFQGEVEFDSSFPMEWSTAEDPTETRDDFDVSWLKPGMVEGSFTPSRLPKATPDPKDGVPEEIAPLDWQEEAGANFLADLGVDAPDVSDDEPAVVATTEAPTEAPTEETFAPDFVDDSERATQAQTTETDSLQEVNTESPADTSKAGEGLFAAHAALEAGAYNDALAHYKNNIRSLRGKKLDALIAELESLTQTQQTSSALFDLLGLAYTCRKNFEAAAVAYRRAIALGA